MCGLNFFESFLQGAQKSQTCARYVKTYTKQRKALTRTSALSVSGVGREMLQIKAILKRSATDMCICGQMKHCAVEKLYKTLKLGSLNTITAK